MLAAAAYDHGWRQLYLEFRSGEIYCYRDMPVHRYEQLLNNSASRLIVFD
jgi:hypothetical protein